MLSSMHVPLPRSSSKHKKKELRQRLEKVWNKQENQYCIDCDEKNTSWASILAPVLGASKKMAVFLCYKCCNYHMTLGRDICLVKNLKTADDWTEEEIRVLEAAGNDIANVIYEGKLNIQKPSPQDHDAQQMFIYAKYKNLDFLCHKTYEGHHGMWLSSYYKETVNTMNQMAEAVTTVPTTTSIFTSTKASDTKSSIFSSSRASTEKTPVEFGPELPPEAAKCGPESQSDTSTALTESESTIGEEHVVNNWEPDAIARTIKATEEKQEAEASKERSDNVKNDKTESDLDATQRTKTMDESFVMNQRLQSRLAGRRSSAISGRRRASVSTLDAGSLHRAAAGARRERRSDPNLVGLPNESKDSAKGTEDDESKATEEVAAGEPTITSEKKSSANNLLDHSKSPSTRRMGRRTGRRSTICTGSGSGTIQEGAGQIKQRSAPNLQDLSKSPSSRRLVRPPSVRANKVGGAGDLDESPTKQRRTRPRMSMRIPATSRDGDERRPRKSMSRKSLSMDDTPDLVKAKDGDEEKPRPRPRRSGSRRSISMNCTPEQIAQLKDAEKEDTDKEGDAAEEKPKPRPRRGMSRRSVSMDCSPEQVAQLKKEAAKGKAGMEEKPKPRPRKAPSRRSLSMEGSMHEPSLHGASSQGKSHRTRKSSLNKSKSFDATTIKNRGFAHEVDIDTDIDTDLDLSISGANEGDSKTRRNGMTEIENKSLVLKGVSVLASLDPKEKNAIEDMVDSSGGSNKDNPTCRKSRAELRAAVSMLSSQFTDPTIATYYKSVSN